MKLASCLYVVGIAVVTSGKLAPFSLLLVVCIFKKSYQCNVTKTTPITRLFYFTYLEQFILKL